MDEVIMPFNKTDGEAPNAYGAAVSADADMVVILFDAEATCSAALEDNDECANRDEAESYPKRLFGGRADILSVDSYRTGAHGLWLCSGAVRAFSTAASNFSAGFCIDILDGRFPVAWHSGFFLSIAFTPDRPNKWIWSLYSGALLLATSVVVLGVGLIRAV